MRDDPGFTVAPAPYAKGKMLVRCKSDGSGFKTRAMCLCEHLKGRWVNRGGGYIMSPRAAKRLQELFDAGRNASPITGELREISGEGA